ncbi:MAG: stage II sporulation protein P [Butyrivibrio sp.]|nr:stage II sporulation protein P [Acetatifactor muris]MCM1558095.1 stage II sporulation protein P [Butyrivibrio sp.]MCM1560458.1 stage II sporulation protein P [Butyrivibrio sp.]
MAKGKSTPGRPWAAKAAVAALLIPALLGTVRGCGKTAESEASVEKSTVWDGILLEMVDAAEEGLYEMFMPGILFGRLGSHKTCWLLQEQIDSLLPLYGYVTENSGEDENGYGNLREYSMPEKDGVPEDSFLREILLAEAEEGISEQGLEEEWNPSGKEQQGDGERSLEELFREENQAAAGLRNPGTFVPHAQQAQVDLESLQDYETLLKQFYIVDSNTMASSDHLNVESFLAKDMTLSGDGQEPQILIFHTHSREGFADSVEGDPATTIVGVGERLAQILRDTYGYNVIHHTEEYDTDRNQAYSRALPGVEQVLRENPSIQVVIDLHRDQMPEETRLVMDLDGRPTARFMFFNGLSRTKKTGDIAYLYNENLDDNLAFSFQMQKKAAEYYPGLTRKIYLKGYRYNMHLKDKYLLVELGAQNNTLEEAMNACDPLAHILDMVLSSH